jgi:hypothetical protein
MNDEDSVNGSSGRFMGFGKPLRENPSMKVAAHGNEYEEETQKLSRLNQSAYSEGKQALG